VLPGLIVTITQFVFVFARQIFSLALIFLQEWQCFFEILSLEISVTKELFCLQLIIAVALLQGFFGNLNRFVLLSLEIINIHNIERNDPRITRMVVHFLKGFKGFLIIALTIGNKTVVIISVCVIRVIR